MRKRALCAPDHMHSGTSLLSLPSPPLDPTITRDIQMKSVHSLVNHHRLKQKCGIASVQKKKLLHVIYNIV